jgi:CRP-like cAMP-binding protein
MARAYIPPMQVAIRKLQSLWPLSAAEQGALLGIIGKPQEVAKGEDIVVDGARPSCSTVMLAGVAARCKMLPNGERQILAFQYPGDFTDIYSYVLRRVDHAVTALTACRVAHLPHQAIEKVTKEYPNLTFALWRDSMVDSSIFQMWLVNMGCRGALSRLAHLLCEQFLRLHAVGLAEYGQPVDLHLVQADLADATGLSLVHINRTLKELRSRGLLARHPGKLEILDWQGLAELAEFDPTYLHYRQTGTAELGDEQRQLIR